MTSSSIGLKADGGLPVFAHGFAPAVTEAVREVQRWLALQSLPRTEPEPLFGPGTSVIWATTQASAYELQMYAWRRLAAVRSDGDAQPSKAALQSLDGVIRSLVADNGPTPQVGATPSGSVEVQWLADGTLVSALFDESGEFNIYAVDDHDAVLIDDELPSGGLPDKLRVELAGILGEMSTKVVQRPSSWFARV